jgi:hypothetical protein
MPVLSHWLGSVLENQYPQAPIASFEPAQAIVVLGGGIAPPSGKWLIHGKRPLLFDKRYTLTLCISIKANHANFKMG